MNEVAATEVAMRGGDLIGEYGRLYAYGRLELDTRDSGGRSCGKI